MGLLKLKRWDGHEGGLTRRDRQPCDYACYFPDLLAERAIVLDGEVAARVAEAEAAILAAQTDGAPTFNTETIARLLLRAESVASSRIEGLVVGPRKLLRVQAAREAGEKSSDLNAVEVLNNIDAMLRGIRSAGPHQALTLEDLMGVHRRLLTGTGQAEHAGKFRTQQNWIGGSNYTPLNADFVPPPPEHVQNLMEDLCRFCNTSDLSPVTQAALAHAQFETIHPFVDGNGRTGRALIHMVLRKRGLVADVLPPISLVLATMHKDYVGGLTATRYIGAPDSEKAYVGTNLWVERFATACKRAVVDIQHFKVQADSIRASWRQRLGKVRSDSAVVQLIDLLVSMPIVSVNTAAAMIERTFPATNNAIATLVERGILKQVSIGQRNRAFEAPEVISAFTSLERRLASPAGDTRIARPSRPTPARR